MKAGDQLGPYRVLEKLGEGGMGEVYKARDTRLDRTVAIKVLPPDVASDPERRARFEREAHAIAALNHPHICTLYDIGQQGGTTYLVMEHLDGETLADRLRRGPLVPVDALDIAAEIGDALGVAHARGIVHRDLKPANVIVDEHGHAKIIDFGLAKLREPAGAEDTTALTDATAPGLVMGTVSYMSPEQARGLPADARADVWSLGVMLYEMLAGRRPFVGPSPSDIVSAILTCPPSPLDRSETRLPSPVDEDVQRVLQRCLAKDRNERYQSARDLVLDLQVARRDLEEPSRTGRSLFPRSRGRAAALMSLITVVMAAVVGWAILSRRPALAFQERDFVLIADVVNETGEPVFDLALKSAIETDLRQSRYVNVYDPAQVQNMLQMMRLKPDARLDQGVGRDICRRAGLRALVVPRILRAGGAYQVGAAIVEPSSGRVVEEVQASAEGREQVLLTTIDKVTRQLRQRLGESLASISRRDPPVAQYTTSSLEALELCTLGGRAAARTDHAAAERYYRQALQHDPHFAIARGALGLVLLQFRGQPEEGKKELAQALADAGEISQREHLQLRALNRQYVTEDLPAALEDYRFISQLYPDMFQPYNNSGRILQQLGRYQEAEAMYDRAHQADPRHPIPLWNTYFLCAGPLRKPRKAEATARALVALDPDVANTRHVLAWSLVMQRRFGEAEEEMKATLRIDPSHAWARPNLAHLQLRRGAVNEAIEGYRGLSGQEHDALCLGLALQAAGRRAEARTVARAAAKAMKARGRRKALDSGDQGLLAALLAMAGQTAEARAYLARAERARDAAGLDALWLARGYLAVGDDDRAATLVEQALAAGCDDPYFILIDPSLAAIRDRPAIDRLLKADG